MEVLTFRPTRRQIALPTAAAVVLAIAAAAILVPRYAAGVNVDGPIFGWGLAFTICAPAIGWGTFKYSRAYTECSPAGIRSRGLGHEWRCDWPHVREIAIRTSANPQGPTTYTVIVTTASGDRPLLGMPVTGGLMPDADFEAKVKKIRAYWQDAIGAHSALGAPVPSVFGGAALVTPRTVWRMCVELTLLAAVITVPFTVRASGPALLARLGFGQQGYFTASTLACDSSCYWVGNFTPSHSAPPQTGIAMAPGARIARGGQRVAAAYMGNGRLAYPARGGPNWIPLALLLLIIVACLVPTAAWFIGWCRRARRSRVVDYGRESAPQRSPDRTMSSAGAGIIVALAMVVAAFGGGALGYAAHLVPVSPSPATLACSEYRAWVQAQPEVGSSDVSPALLAAATQDATGQLQTDLATLSGDVAAEIAPGSTGGVAGLVALAKVDDDMATVLAACKPVV